MIEMERVAVAAPRPHVLPASPAISMADPTPSELDLWLVAELRRGDEVAFERLLEREHGTMLRVARLYTRSAAEAEDVVQETWMAVLLGLSGFQGRSSLRTWIFRILSNIARNRAVRDRRTIPFSQLVRREVASTKALVDHQFVADDDLEWAGHWDTTVSDWGQRGDLVLMSAEVLACIAGAMRTMPPAQSEVLRLRDIEGWGPSEVSAALRISRNNQRVLLHRARCWTRAALNRYFDE